jgi:hypothetical protein
VAAVLRSRRNPPHAAQAPQKTAATVRNLASVAAAIALTFRNPAAAWSPPRSSLNPRAFESAAKKNRVQPRTLLDGDEDAGCLAFANNAHDVISGTELLSIHCLVEVRFGFALEQNHRRR